jgi:serine/threonine protein phosphatase PrpC
MEKGAERPTDDALQRRLARFVAEAKTPRSLAGSAGIWIGTNLGAVREQNQDRVLVTSASYKTAPQKNFVLGALCDGIGGLARGEDAAVLAISVFVSRFLRTPKLSTADRLRGAATAANAAVYAMLGGRGGTTLSAVLVNGQDHAVGVNVGDSRIYSISHSRELIQLSRDDTLGEVLGRRDDPMHRNELLQFLGMGEGLEPHILAPRPEDSVALLVTSDGIHGAPSDAFAQVVRNARTGGELIRRLIDFSDALGGHDNGTAFVLPARVTAPQPDEDQGLNLQFWSASDRLEIWIPVLADEVRQEHLPPALTEARDTDTGEQAETRRKAWDDSSTRRARRASKKKKFSNDEGLPLDKAERPPLDIRFPGKG